MPVKLKSEFTEQVTVRMDDKMYRALADTSRREFLTVAQYIRKLIRDNAMNGTKDKK